MSNLKTELKTEAVILMRQNGTTMAVHVPNLQLLMSPVINEPDIRHALIYFMPPPTIEGYEVEASGIADKITVWAGPDPFVKDERMIRNHVEGIEA